MKSRSVSVAVSFIVAMVTVVTFFLAILGMANYQSQKSAQIEQLQQALNYSAEELSSAVALPLWNFDQDQIDSILESAMKFESIYGLILLREGEAQEAATVLRRGANWRVVKSDSLFPEDGLAVAERAVLMAQKPVGTIRIFASPKFIEAKLHRVLIQTAVAIAAIDILLVVALYYIVWRTILGPLQRIEAFATEAARHDGVTGMGDLRFQGELESLRSAIERMTALLASRLASLQEQSQRMSEQEQKARLSELRVQQILAASPLPITVANFKTGVYVVVNPAWERHFQYSQAEVLGKTSIDLGFWADMQDRQGWIDRFNNAGRVSGYEVTFQMRSGQPKIYMLSSERFLYGDEDCVLTMSVDVTERKQLESELKRLNASLEHRVTERTRDLDRSNQELRLTMQTLQRTQDELIQSEKLASLGSLVAGVAHELNTPIGNAMVAASSMAEEVSRMQRTVAEGAMKRSTFDTFLGRVAEGAELTMRSLYRGVALISSFKQVAVDQASERRREFDLKQVINEVVDTLRPRLKHEAVQLQLDLADGITMQSYPGPLGQVIINLFTNALAHAFEGREAGSIAIATRKLDESSVRLTVTDDGVGISSANMGQIFDPFFTTKLGKGGSGLGLSISHRIVSKVLGGQISIQSSPGQGAVFELVIPIRAPEVVH